MNMIEYIKSIYPESDSAEKIDIEYVDTPYNESRYCYKNSFLYLFSSTDPDVKYVLGYHFIKGSIPIEHAWIKRGDKHLELTIKPTNGSFNFSLYELSHDETMSIFLANDNYPPTLYDVVNARTLTKNSI